jgi:hypothetical protein
LIRFVAGREAPQARGHVGGRYALTSQHHIKVIQEVALELFITKEKAG